MKITNMKLNQHSYSLGNAPLPAEPPGRILAVDYGRQRIGLAISDEFRQIAQPLTILSRRNRENDLRRLRELCRKHGVRQIIVGLPLHLNGSESEMSKEASRFATRLKNNLGLPVELVDERLTSWDAAQTRPAANNSRRRQGAVDDVAAALILREFLEKNGARTSSQPIREAC